MREESKMHEGNNTNGGYTILGPIYAPFLVPKTQGHK